MVTAKTERTNTETVVKSYNTLSSRETWPQSLPILKKHDDFLRFWPLLADFPSLFKLQTLQILVLHLETFNLPVNFEF